jgi:hypothetical protein
MKVMGSFGKIFLNSDLIGDDFFPVADGQRLAPAPPAPFIARAWD